MTEETYQFNPPSRDERIKMQAIALAFDMRRHDDSALDIVKRAQIFESYFNTSRAGM